MCVEELIKLLEGYDPNLEIEVSTGHEDRGRFYGELYRASLVEDYKGKRIRLTGKLKDNGVIEMKIELVEKYII